MQVSVAELPEATAMWMPALERPLRAFSTVSERLWNPRDMEATEATKSPSPERDWWLLTTKSMPEIKSEELPDPSPLKTFTPRRLALDATPTVPPAAVPEVCVP